MTFTLNRLNQETSYEHFDEYRVDDDDVYTNDVQSFVTTKSVLMIACVLFLHSDIFKFQLKSQELL